MRTRSLDKQELVKQKAVEMMAAKGFESFSMNKLAKACNISVATLYIYYKDKDDLIIKIGIEEGQRMTDFIIKDFDPELPFEQGLRFQWQKRFDYTMNNALYGLFFEQLRTSSYHDKVFSSLHGNFKESMGKFVKGAVLRGEIDPVSVEVYWAVAYGPLYTLIRFAHEGRSIGGRPFTIDEQTLWQAFDLVVKALKK
ncbi:MAG: TetR/AcrR family transcriptional regulator [Sphingobacteriales bacterium]|nr:TetR/AcrR family transcriptional regulator [Sphingobacteriales bacterium]